MPEVESAPNFFFCNGAVFTQRTAVGILTGLIHQCLKRNPRFASKIAKPYHQALKGDQWDVDTLWKLLVNFINAGLGTFLIIDGLDECDDDFQTLILQRFHKLLSSSALLRPFKVILACRPTFAIKTTMISCPSFLKLIMEQERETIKKDLSIAIKANVANFAMFYNIDPEMQEEISRELEEKADGNFLWATIAEDLISRKSIITNDGIEQLLNSLPSGLPGIYNTLLKSIDLCRNQFALNALKWITLAPRPMKLAEMRVALALQPDSRDMEDVARYQPYNVEAELMKTFSSLVKVLNDEVHLVHESAKDFLLGQSVESNQGPKEPHVRIFPSTDHASLAHACLK